MMLNGRLDVRTVVDTSVMDWTPSPSGTVWRRRVHLVGPQESGQVTSVVRYTPASKFPAHDHPDGEEILVLDGVFSDEQGDWPAGTYLLNPEGFRHTPYSQPGCRLFVKLRQYPGRDRVHLAIQTREATWRTLDPGVRHLPLYAQAEFRDEMHLERWSVGAEVGERRYPQGAELFVIEGRFADEQGEYGRETWMRLPAGSTHRPSALEEVLVYVKTGGFSYLRSS